VRVCVCVRIHDRYSDFFVISEFRRPVVVVWVVVGYEFYRIGGRSLFDFRYVVFQSSYSIYKFRGEFAELQSRDSENECTLDENAVVHVVE